MIELKAVDTAFAQTVGNSVRRADLTVLEILHAAQEKSKP